MPDETTGDRVAHSPDLPVDNAWARFLAMAGCSLVKLAGANWADLDAYGRSKFLHDEARKLPVPDWTRGEGPRHSIMTIVARRGFAVVGPDEAAWLIAWRYSNHGLHAYSGDLILVTEHGWTDFMTEWGDLACTWLDSSVGKVDVLALLRRERFDRGAQRCIVERPVERSPSRDR